VILWHFRSPASETHPVQVGDITPWPGLYDGRTCLWACSERSSTQEQNRFAGFEPAE